MILPGFTPIGGCKVFTLQQHSHEAIIPSETWELVQLEMERRKRIGNRFSAKGPLASRLVCADCGGFFGSKVWHSTDAYKTVIWRCNQKYNPTTQRASGGRKCNTRHVTEEQVYRAFQGIAEEISAQRPEVVAACEAVLADLMDTADLDKAEKRLNGEKERIQAKAVALNNEASHRLISDYGERRGELERKLSLVEEKLKALSAERSDREYKARQCELYLDKVKRLNLEEKLVDSETFMALVDKVVVGEGMKFILKDRSEWELEYAPLDGDEAQEKKSIGEASGVA